MYDFPATRLVVVLLLACTSSVLSRHNDAMSIVVDDHDASMVTPAQSSSYGPGWFAPCSDAFAPIPNNNRRRGLDYHHDFAGEHGLLEINIKAPLSNNGCFLVEEWHPGADEQCARYLPQNAKLSVHTTNNGDPRNGIVALSVDQSQGGGRWNRLGVFALEKDADVHLTLSNNGGGKDHLRCDAESCWLVADAWRFTQAPDHMCNSSSSSSSSVDDLTVAPHIPQNVDCTGFGNALLSAVRVCSGVTTCDNPAFALGQPCRAAADAFTGEWEFQTGRCLMRCMQEKRELIHRGATVEAVLACPSEHAAVEQSMSEAAAGAVIDRTSSSPATVETPATAAVWDGDCTDFKSFAEQVAQKCSKATCCKDVIDHDECRVYAAGLHVLFPSNAIQTCAARTHLNHRCSCFVRQVAACSLQNDVHMLLYGETWAPSCSAFPATLYQGDPADVVALSASNRYLTIGLVAAILLLIASLVVARRSRARARTLAEHTPTATVIGLAIVQQESDNDIVTGAVVDFSEDDDVVTIGVPVVPKENNPAGDSNVVANT